MPVRPMPPSQWMRTFCRRLLCSQICFTNDANEFASSGVPKSGIPNSSTGTGDLPEQIASWECGDEGMLLPGLPSVTGRTRLELSRLSSRAHCKEQLHVAPLARNKLLVLLRFYGVERCAALMVEVNPPPVRLRQRRRTETGPRLLEEARPQLIPAALDLFPAETLASDKDLEQNFLLGVRVGMPREQLILNPCNG